MCLVGGGRDAAYIAFAFAKAEDNPVELKLSSQKSKQLKLSYVQVIDCKISL